ncbi:MAG: His/Gly/Thr/Pro-type tRNA ligase C-terminal domain-containing protein, partial [Methanosarcinaceae archaeon]|nr:His/Gly/Thr/Pro-type tRNA ligase C-terminal domain-containing protein [Methanosarcinaceae archaeon]
YDLKAHSKVSKTELAVYVEYPEPKLVTSFVVKPNMGKLGPIFKGKAKAVAEALKGLSEAELSKEEIHIAVAGEEITLSSDMVDFAEETVKVSGESLVPHVIEPSYGIDRIFYGTLEHAYDAEDVGAKAAESGLKGQEELDELESAAEEEVGETRLVMHFSSAVAPVQVAVLPLLTRKELTDPAKAILAKLMDKNLMTAYDDSGTIGRRYRRNDEIGTPYSITVDYTSLEDKTVTIRDRDSMRQVRAPIEGLEDVLYDLIYKGRSFESAGKPFNFQINSE